MAKAALGLHLAALLCIIALAKAYPTFWVVQNEAVASCVAHPAMAEGLHQAPLRDTSSVMVVVDAAGKPVTAVCPGGQYSLTVTFPQARRALLTSSQGSLAKAVDNACPSRSFTTREGGAALSFNDTLAVPCNVTGPSIELAVTSAAGKNAAFNSLATTLAVKPPGQCPTSTCTAGAGRTGAVNETQSPSASAAASTAAAPGAVAGPTPAAAATQPARSSAFVAAFPLDLAVAVLCAVMSILVL